MSLGKVRNKQMVIDGHGRGNYLLPNQAAKTWRSRWPLRMLLAVVLSCAVLPGAPVPQAGGSARGQAPRLANAVLLGAPVPQADEKPAAGPADNRLLEREITKLIPDQKVLVGAPATIIDLTHVFDDREVAAGGGKLEMAIPSDEKEEKNKQADKSKQVVSAKIVDGTQLVLKWGKLGKTKVTIRVKNEQTGRILDETFHVQVWEPDYWKLLFTVVGGLGIFLLGMKNMSEGMQAVAGNGLRRMISAVTNNRLMATGVGVLVTMLLQSSSITTVMVVGFVNSGFMTLSQAIGVIMGANIGTTITGWILALEIGKYGLPIAGLGAFGYLFSKRDRWRFTLMAVMGLGLVFFGLELMKNGFAVVKDLPEFLAWFELFNADTYLGVLKCAAVGCVLTFIVQSSSATLGITISLAATGVIPFESAAALVLGENIGTTITAWLASLGATTNAKRSAYFHILFNLIGVAWITALFRWYMMIIRYIITGEVDGDVDIYQVTAAIAATHTGFNVANTLLFLPFVQFFATLLERLVPDKAHKEKPHLMTNLDIRMLETPVIAIEQSRIEVLRMADGCGKMMIWLKEILGSEVPDDGLVQKTFHREEVLDTVHDEIVDFMSNLLSGSVPHTFTDEARQQLRMADEYESVSDYLVNILKSHLKLQHSGLRFPNQEQQKLLDLHDMTADYLQLISQGYAQRHREVITKAHSRGDAVTHRVKELRNQFLAKLSDEPLDPQLTVAFAAQLNAYRRVRDHALNIAEALAGEK